MEATVERLFLIVNPTAEVKYDPQKEEKMALAAKQAELARVEEAKKKEAEKGTHLAYTPIEKFRYFGRFKHKNFCRFVLADTAVATI